MGAVGGHSGARCAGVSVVGLDHIGAGQHQGCARDAAIAAEKAVAHAAQVVIGRIVVAKRDVGDGVVETAAHIFLRKSACAVDGQFVTGHFARQTYDHVAHSGGAVIHLAHARGVRSHGLGVDAQISNKHRRTDKVATCHSGTQVLDGVITDHGLAGAAGAGQCVACIRLEHCANGGAQAIAEGVIVAGPCSGQCDDGGVVRFEVLGRGHVGGGRTIGHALVGGADQQLVGGHDGECAVGVSDFVVVRRQTLGCQCTRVNTCSTVTSIAAFDQQGAAEHAAGFTADQTGILHAPKVDAVG